MTDENHQSGSVLISLELVVEILKCLPVKSLLRFMSVCKSWYSLIKSHDFISSHFSHQLSVNNSVNEPRKLLYHGRTMLEKYYVYTDNHEFERNLEFIDHIRGVCSVACCNGIVLFMDMCEEDSLVLWNSSLRKSRDLRVPHRRVSTSESFAYWLGFDLKIDLTIVAIAYLVSDLWEETSPTGVYRYSLSLDTWMPVRSSFLLDGEYTILNGGVYWNGVIHWVAQSIRGYQYQGIRSCILTFGLYDQEFHTADFPKETEYLPGLSENDPVFDSVCLVTMRRYGREYLTALHLSFEHFRFWLMKLNSWTEVFSVNHDVSYLRVLNVTPKGQTIIKLVRGGVVSLDPARMKLKAVSVENMIYLGTYFESLILL